MACVFFLGIFPLTRLTHLFISPDETANAFFIRSFLHTGSFRVFDSMNELFGGVLHPRSMLADGAYYVPGSFLGLSFLYAMFTKILGGWSLTFLTPIMVIFASFAWNKIMRVWFSKQVALVSSFLFLFHPAIWYYAARGLMPNVLFVCCVVFSIYFLLCFEKQKKYVPHTFFLSGIFLALALFVRLSEAFWLLPIFAVLFYIEQKKRSWRSVVAFLIGCIIPLSLLFFLNFKTYGHPFVFGYSFVSSTQTAQVITAQQTPPIQTGFFIFPFGFHPRAVFWHTLDYLFLLFWWLTIPALCAMPLVFKKNKQKIYTIVTITVAIWLSSWYGSWRLHDNPDPTQITIANSYVRYWLPIFVMSTPLIATSIVWLSDKIRSKKIGLFILFSCLLVVFSLNVRIVFLSGQDALVNVISILQQSTLIRDRVFQIVPENGVIMTDRSDKIFFPGRRVMVPLRSEQTYASIPKLAERVPLYYYGVSLPQKDLDFLNTQRLNPHDLRIEFVETFGVESLYEVRRGEEKK